MDCAGLIAFKDVGFCLALATFNIIVNTDSVGQDVKKNITITAKRELSLLYDFLDKLLFFLDTEGFLLNSIKDIKIKKKEDELVLICTAIGSLFKEFNYDVQGNIKSVTYNNMNIKKTDKGYDLTVVIDI